MVEISRRKENKLTLGNFILFGKDIPLSASVKHVGITFDCKLL